MSRIFNTVPRNGFIEQKTEKPSVADPGCLSGTPDLNFYPSGFRIQHQQQKRRGKKLVALHFFVSKNKHFILNR
jgi:hypothetical protein